MHDQIVSLNEAYKARRVRLCKASDVTMPSQVSSARATCHANLPKPEVLAALAGRERAFPVQAVPGQKAVDDKGDQCARGAAKCQPEQHEQR